MAHLDPTERWGFGVCFLIGLRQAKDRGGRPPCCPSPWLVDLIFPEVCGLSQNGSTSYLRHTCVIPLTQFWAESVFWGLGLWEVRGLSQNGSASYLRHIFDTVFGRMGLLGYRAEPATNEGATYWTTAGCAPDSLGKQIQGTYACTWLKIR